MMTKILDIAFSGFFPFVGIVILLHIVLDFLIRLSLGFWNRVTRTLMVRKHGWPPSHLDADGDWEEKEPVVDEQK